MSGEQGIYEQGARDGVADLARNLTERLESMIYSAKQFPPSDFGNGQISSFTAMLILLEELTQKREGE